VEGTATFEPRLMLPLSLSYDHRVVDGADAIRFLRWVARRSSSRSCCRCRDSVHVHGSTTQLAVIGGRRRRPRLRRRVPRRRPRPEVTLIDEEANPGGVCLYRGCIPSKALLHVAKLEEAKHASAWGIEFAEPKVDLDKLRAFKQGVVDRLTGGLGQLSKQRKVPTSRGGRDRRPHTLESRSRGRASSIRSSTPSSPPGRGRRRCPACRSTARACSTRPRARPARRAEALLVVGGGYIGLELGTVYAALGSKVTVVEMTDGPAARGRPRPRQRPGEAARAMCEAVRLNTKVVGDEGGGDGVQVTFEGAADPEGAGVRPVLVSVGRKPNSRSPASRRRA
jgi:dihydrolipoamide dehydrogenase